MGIAGFIGLVWRMKLTDVAISAAIPLGMMLTAVALITGSLWGTPTWGTWWEWDGRTVSTLVLFFLYFGIYALRQAIKDSSVRANSTAIIAMVGTLNIPIIKYSVDWWNTLHQPATFMITEKPAMPSEMWLPLLVMVIGFYCFAGHNVISRMRIEICVVNREALGLKASLRLERKLAMYFESFEALLAMGGHGRYVWSAYGIAIAVLLWNQLVVKVSRKLS